MDIDKEDFYTKQIYNGSNQKSRERIKVGEKHLNNYLLDIHKINNETAIYLNLNS